MPAIRHHHVEVDGLKVFVREAGDPSRPTVVLLPGYPSSTRHYVRLIDDPGFGSSDPLPGEPTFDRLAEVTGRTIDLLGIGDYAVYVFDFGSPVGFRVALDHDQRVRAVITQNGNAYVEGLGPDMDVLKNHWNDRSQDQDELDWVVSLEGTRHQWLVGARNPEHIDPEQALADQHVIDLPGRADYMKALLWDYRNNPGRYPSWQRWLRERRPEVLAVWGRRDTFFIPAGAEAFRRDVPSAEVVLLDTGHFALEEEVDEIAERVNALLGKTFA
jgi:pimeloyl-ACP methyl ester carboxylesterase